VLDLIVHRSRTAALPSAGENESIQERKIS